MNILKHNKKMIDPFENEQTTMFDVKKPHFNGPDYVKRLDHKRLTNQNIKIKNLMMDGKWRTLKEIEIELGFPQASISAQLRHLRKNRFGGFTIEKQRRRIEGLFEYQLLK